MQDMQRLNSLYRGASQKRDKLLKNIIQLTSRPKKVKKRNLSLVLVNKKQIRNPLNFVNSRRAIISVINKTVMMATLAKAAEYGSQLYQGIYNGYIRYSDPVVFHGYQSF